MVKCFKTGFILLSRKALPPWSHIQVVRDKNFYALGAYSLSLLLNLCKCVFLLISIFTYIKYVTFHPFIKIILSFFLSLYLFVCLWTCSYYLAIHLSCLTSLFRYVYLDLTNAHFRALLLTIYYLGNSITGLMCFGITISLKL